MPVPRVIPQPPITVRTFVLDNAKNLYFEVDTPSVGVSGGSASAGNYIFLDANGKIDPSFLYASSGVVLKTNGVNNPLQSILNLIAGAGVQLVADAFGGVTISNTGSSSASFTDVTSGTNIQAAMIVGSGASVDYMGTGTLNASSIAGVAVLNTPSSPGQVLVSQPGNTSALWTTIATGSGNFLQVLVDFGFAGGEEGDVARTTVTGQAWVGPASILLANPAAVPSPDHDPDDTVVEGLDAYVQNIVAGVGFDVVAYAPRNSWGRYYINVTGQ